MGNSTNERSWFEWKVYTYTSFLDKVERIKVCADSRQSKRLNIANNEGRSLKDSIVGNLTIASTDSLFKKVVYISTNISIMILKYFPKIMV